MMDTEQLEAIRDRDRLAHEQEPLFGLLPAERDVRDLLAEVDRLRTRIGNMADDNSPHDAQAAAQRFAAEWDPDWRTPR